MNQVSQAARGQVFDAHELREKHRSLSTDELLAIVTIDAGDYIEEALAITRDELRVRGVTDSQVEHWTRDYKVRAYDQRRSESVLRDEAEVLEIARTQLRSHGAGTASFDEQVLDMKAARFDVGRAPMLKMVSNSRKASQLPRWMYLVCLYDLGVFSALIIAVLIAEGRNQDVIDALRAFAYGWALKLLGVFITVLSFLAYLGIS